LSTVKPAFLASLTETGLSFTGELKLEMICAPAFCKPGNWSTRRAQRSAQGELSTANRAVAGTKFVFVKWHLLNLVQNVPRSNPPIPFETAPFTYT